MIPKTLREILEAEKPLISDNLAELIRVSNEYGYSPKFLMALTKRAGAPSLSQLTPGVGLKLAPEVYSLTGRQPSQNLRDEAETLSLFLRNFPGEKEEDVLARAILGSNFVTVRAGIEEARARVLGLPPPQEIPKQQEVLGTDISRRILQEELKPYTQLSPEETTNLKETLITLTRLLRDPDFQGNTPQAKEVRNFISTVRDNLYEYLKGFGAPSTSFKIEPSSYETLRTQPTKVRLGYALSTVPLLPEIWDTIEAHLGVPYPQRTMTVFARTIGMTPREMSEATVEFFTKYWDDTFRGWFGSVYDASLTDLFSADFWKRYANERQDPTLLNDLGTRLSASVTSVLAGLFARVGTYTPLFFLSVIAGAVKSAPSILTPFPVTRIPTEEERYEGLAETTPDLVEIAKNLGLFIVDIIQGYGELDTRPAREIVGNTLDGLLIVFGVVGGVARWKMGRLMKKYGEWLETYSEARAKLDSLEQSLTKTRAKIRKLEALITRNENKLEKLENQLTRLGTRSVELSQKIQRRFDIYQKRLAKLQKVRDNVLQEYNNTQNELNSVLQIVTAEDVVKNHTYPPIAQAIGERIERSLLTKQDAHKAFGHVPDALYVKTNGEILVVRDYGVLLGDWNDPVLMVGKVDKDAYVLFTDRNLYGIAPDRANLKPGYYRHLDTGEPVIVSVTGKTARATNFLRGGDVPLDKLVQFHPLRPITLENIISVYHPHLAPLVPLTEVVDNVTLLPNPFNLLGHNYYKHVLVSTTDGYYVVEQGSIRAKPPVSSGTAPIVARARKVTALRPLRRASDLDPKHFEEIELEVTGVLGYLNPDFEAIAFERLVRQGKMKPHSPSPALIQQEASVVKEQWVEALRGTPHLVMGQATLPELTIKTALIRYGFSFDDVAQAIDDVVEHLNSRHLNRAILIEASNEPIVSPTIAQALVQSITQSPPTGGKLTWKDLQNRIATDAGIQQAIQNEATARGRLPKEIQDKFVQDYWTALDIVRRRHIPVSSALQRVENILKREEYANRPTILSDDVDFSAVEPLILGEHARITGGGTVISVRFPESVTKGLATSQIDALKEFVRNHLQRQIDEFSPPQHIIDAIEDEIKKGNLPPGTTEAVKDFMKRHLFTERRNIPNFFHGRQYASLNNEIRNATGVINGVSDVIGFPTEEVLKALKDYVKILRDKESGTVLFDLVFHSPLQDWSRLLDDVKAGKITLEQAVEELNKAIMGRAVRKAQILSSSKRLTERELTASGVEARMERPLEEVLSSEPWVAGDPDVVPDMFRLGAPETVSTTYASTGVLLSTGEMLPGISPNVLVVPLHIPVQPYMEMVKGLRTTHKNSYFVTVGEANVRSLESVITPEPARVYDLTSGSRTTPLSIPADPAHRFYEALRDIAPTVLTDAVGDLRSKLQAELANLHQKLSALGIRELKEWSDTASRVDTLRMQLEKLVAKEGKKLEEFLELKEKLRRQRIKRAMLQQEEYSLDTLTMEKRRELFDEFFVPFPTDFAGSLGMPPNIDINIPLSAWARIFENEFGKGLMGKIIGRYVFPVQTLISQLPPQLAVPLLHTSARAFRYPSEWMAKLKSEALTMMDTYGIKDWGEWGLAGHLAQLYGENKYTFTQGSTIVLKNGKKHQVVSTVTDEPFLDPQTNKWKIRDDQTVIEIDEIDLNASDPSVGRQVLAHAKNVGIRSDLVDAVPEIEEKFYRKFYDEVREVYNETLNGIATEVKEGLKRWYSGDELDKRIEKIDKFVEKHSIPYRLNYFTHAFKELKMLPHTYYVDARLTSIEERLAQVYQRKLDELAKQTGTPPPPGTQVVPVAKGRTQRVSPFILPAWEGIQAYVNVVMQRAGSFEFSHHVASVMNLMATLLEKSRVTAGGKAPSIYIPQNIRALMSEWMNDMKIHLNVRLKPQSFMVKEPSQAKILSAVNRVAGLASFQALSYNLASAMMQMASTTSVMATMLAVDPKGFFVHVFPSVAETVMGLLLPRRERFYKPQPIRTAGEVYPVEEYLPQVIQRRMRKVGSFRRLHLAFYNLFKTNPSIARLLDEMPILEELGYYRKLPPMPLGERIGLAIDAGLAKAISLTVNEWLEFFDAIFYESMARTAFRIGRQFINPKTPVEKRALFGFVQKVLDMGFSRRVASELPPWFASPFMSNFLLWQLEVANQFSNYIYNSMKLRAITEMKKGVPVEVDPIKIILPRELIKTKDFKRFYGYLAGWVLLNHFLNRYVYQPLLNRTPLPDPVEWGKDTIEITGDREMPLAVKLARLGGRAVGEVFGSAPLAQVIGGAIASGLRPEERGFYFGGTEFEYSTGAFPAREVYEFPAQLFALATDIMPWFYHHTAHDVPMSIKLARQVNRQVGRSLETYYYLTERAGVVTDEKGNALYTIPKEFPAVLPSLIAGHRLSKEAEAYREKRQRKIAHPEGYQYELLFRGEYPSITEPRFRLPRPRVRIFPLPKELEEKPTPPKKKAPFETFEVPGLRKYLE